MIRLIALAAAFALIASSAWAQTETLAMTWGVDSSQIDAQQIVRFEVLDYTESPDDENASVWVTVPLTNVVPGEADEYYYPLTADRGGLHTPNPDAPHLRQLRFCSVSGCGPASTLILPTGPDPTRMRIRSISLP